MKIVELKAAKKKACMCDLSLFERSISKVEHIH